MKEDYCSNEVTELLKTNGFETPNRPTHQLAMKLLRDEYNTHILIDFADDCKAYRPRVYVYHDERNIMAGGFYSKWEEVGELTYCDTYEECVESALKYVLENFGTKFAMFK